MSRETNVSALDALWLALSRAARPARAGGGRETFGDVKFSLDDDEAYQAASKVLPSPKEAVSPAFAEETRGKKRKFREAFGPEFASAVGSRAFDAKPTLQEKVRLGQQVEAFRKSYAGRDYLVAFIEQHGKSKSSDKLERIREKTRCHRARNLYLRSLIEDLRGDIVMYRGKRPGGHRTERVAFMRRLRSCGAGRPIFAPEIAEELYVWFLDMQNNLKARVPTCLLQGHAQMLKEDVMRLEARWGSEGVAFTPQKLPKDFDAVWMHRWRLERNLTWKTVNVCYKVSHGKRLFRSGVLWRNSHRVVKWHALCFGPGKIRFLSVDEKPLYMCGTLGKKVLRKRGGGKVSAAENAAAAKSRFTLMSTCPSWKLPPGKKPKVAFCFKADDGEQILNGLRLPASPDDVKIQFAPRASYRLRQFVEFVDWALPECPDPEHAIVPIFDWASHHLHEWVSELVDFKGHQCDLKIGGGITDLVQIPDVIIHKDLNQEYIKLDQIDTIVQMRLRPGSLPDASRQRAVDRGYQAWSTQKHERCVDGHLRCGVGMPLDGSRDDMLRPEILPLWTDPRVDMPRARPLIEKDLEATFAALSPDLSPAERWAMVRNVLEPYDEHRATEEGEELLENGPFDDDDDDGGPDFPGFPGDAPDDDDDLPDDHLVDDSDDEHEDGCQPEEIEGVDERLSASAVRGDGCGHGAAVSQRDRGSFFGGLSGGDVLAGEMPAEQAEREINQAANKDDMLAIAADLRRLGEEEQASMVEQRARARLRCHSKMSPPVRLFLRTQAIERHRLQEGLRVEAVAADSRLKELAAEQKLAETKAEEAKAIAKAAGQTVALARVSEKSRAEKLKAEKMLQKVVDRRMQVLLREQFAAALYRRLLSLSKEETTKLSERATMLIRRGYKLPAMGCPVQIAMAPGREGKPYVMVLNKELPRQPKVYASESFSWELFNHRRPQDVDLLNADPAYRLRVVLYACCPGYRGLVEKYDHGSKGDKIRWPSSALMQQSGYLADLAFLRGVWLYTYVMTPKHFPHGLHSWPLKDLEDFCRTWGISSSPSSAASQSEASASREKVHGSASASSSRASASREKVHGSASASSSRAPAHAARLFLNLTFVFFGGPNWGTFVFFGVRIGARGPARSTDSFYGFRGLRVSKYSNFASHEQPRPSQARSPLLRVRGYDPVGWPAGTSFLRLPASPADLRRPAARGSSSGIGGQATAVSERRRSCLGRAAWRGFGVAIRSDGRAALLDSRWKNNSL